MSEILCAECGKPEDDTKHVKYGPDVESAALGMKHYFVEPSVTLETAVAMADASGIRARQKALSEALEVVGNSESISGAMRRIRDLILE